MATGSATAGSRSEAGETVTFDRLKFQEKLLELKAASDAGDPVRAGELVENLLRLMNPDPSGCTGS